MSIEKMIISEVPIEVSARHIHLTREDYYALWFTKKPEIKRLLSQPWQYLSDVRVNIFCPSKKQVKQVSLLIPFRKETQLELSNSDADFLYDIKNWVYPPRNISGDLNNSFDIILQNPDNKTELLVENSTIRAQAHIHISSMDQEKYSIVDWEKYSLICNEKNLDLIARVHPEFYTVCHIDTDEAKQLWIWKEFGCEKLVFNGFEIQVSASATGVLSCL